MNRRAAVRRSPAFAALVGAVISSILPAFAMPVAASSTPVRQAILATAAQGTTVALASPAPTYAVGKSPAAVVIRDFNGDGILDIVTANSGDNTISLLLGNGDGTFKAATSIAVGISPVTIAAGDFNGDGNWDLAVGNQGSPANNSNTGASIQILLGDGHGGFTTKATYAVAAYAAPAEVVTGDFNKDGKLDLYFATAAWNSSQGHLLMLGNGDGTFQVPTNAFGCAGFGLSVGDFNGDGIPEVASTEFAPSDVCVAIYSPSAATWSRTRVVVRAYPASTAIADFNGDGKPDLVVGSNTLPSGSYNTASVTLGNGDLTFGASSTYTVATPNVPNSFPQGDPAPRVTTGDFSSDGKPDIAMANPGSNSVSILVNRGDGTFAGSSTYPVGSVPVAIAQADLDRNGKADLVTADSGSNTVSVLLNPSATVGMQPTAVSFADQLVGTASAIQTVTVTNFGTTSVTFTGAAFGGASPSSFSITTDRCTSHTVLVGGTCSIDVAFAPPARIWRGIASLNVTDTAGGSPQSILLSGTGDDLPGPPTNVTASFQLDPGGSYMVVVRWGDPVDNGGAPIQSFAVTSSPPGLSAPSVTSGYDVTTFTSNFTLGTTYTFTVTATNVVGTGPPSAASNPVTPLEPPGAPLNVGAVPDDGAAFVTWSPPGADGGSAVTSYDVTSWTGGVKGSTLTVTGAPPATNLFVTGLTNGTAYYFTVNATNVAGTGKPSQPSNTVTPIQGGNFHPLSPARVLDTRDGIGAAIARLPNQGVLHVQITGRGNIPSSGVSAVVMNVTVTNPTAAGFLTVYPTGLTRPTASNLNFVAGQTVPNLVEVAVGDRGALDVYAQFATTSGSADVIFDVAGWVGDATNSMTKDGLYNPLTPARILDTRSGMGAPKAPLGPNQFLTLQVTGAGLVPPSGVSAVILNVTVTGPTAPGYLTVYPADAPSRPTASNLNFVAGQTAPNRVIVKLSALGQVRIYNPAGSVQVIADVGGWFTDQSSTAGGARFTGIAPFRFFDSRVAGAGGPWRPGDIGTLTLLHQNGQPALDVSAIVINVTVTNTTAPSYLTLWPDGSAQPMASDLNWVGGQTVPNLAVVKLGAMNATFDIYNSAGSTDVIIDLVGVYGSSVAAPNGSSAPFSFRISPLRKR
jgi:hypothetical protein